jgi:succinyl-diaminopimelate desuccinylase
MDPIPPNEPRGRLESGLRHIASHAETGAADLARMVAVDTSFPPGNGYPAFASLMEELLAGLDLRLQRISVPEALWFVPDGPAWGERVNLIASRDSSRPRLGLYFHVDTVPASPGWSGSPLTLRRDGARLIGLGTADMKGCIAATLLALRAAQACDVALAYDPVLLLCTDEEGGLYPGVRYLAEEKLLDFHVLNFNGTAAARIWAGCFGTFNVQVRISGKTEKVAHAGDTGGAVNAIEAALPVMNALAALRPIVAARRSNLPPPPNLQGAKLAASLSIAAAHGGTSGGQVPGRLDLLVNRRYPPEESYEDARAEIEQAITAALPADAKAEITLVGHLMPTADPSGPHWPRWQAALSQGFGYAPEDFRAWGASSCSDFGWVQQATGRQEVLLTGLGRPESNIHAPDEHTTIADLIALASSVLAYLAEDFAPDLIPPADRSA